MMIVAAAILALTAAPGPQVLVVDLRGQPRDVRILAATAQGILNADGPRAFLVWNEECVRWMQWDRKRFGVRFHQVGVDQLIRAAAEKARGYVRWDSKRLDTALLAATIAGAEDLLAVSDQCEDMAKAAGLEMKRDLIGRFDSFSRAEMFRWLFDNYRDRCTRKWLLNITVPGVEHWDVTKYARSGGFRLRFEDRTKDDGLGAKLRWLKVVADGREIAAFRVFTDAEKPYLIDADHSWPDAERDRIADRDQYFVYEFKVPAGAEKVEVQAEVLNGYLAKAAPAGSDQYETLPITIKTRANWPSFQTSMLDVAVAMRMMCVDLSSHPDDRDEYAVRDAIARWLDPPACWLGWHTERDGEGQYVYTASKYGHFVICSGACNLSLHRHIKPDRLPRPKIAAPPKLDPAKTYVSFILSDGDALWCDYNFQGHHWLNERRGQVPFGWELQPILRDLGPDILTYYIENATPNDCLVGAFVAGYYHPSAMSPDQLRRYLRFAADVVRDTGFRMCTVLNNRVTERRVAAEFDRHLAGLVDWIEEGYAGMQVNDFVLPHLLWMSTRLPRWNRMRQEQILEDLLKMAAEKPADQPLFVPCHFPIGDANFRTALWLAERLPPDRFAIVRPDQLFALARQWYNTHPRITVPDELLAIEGLAAAASVMVENTTRKPITVEVAAAGLADGPASAQVEPFSQKRIPLRWQKVSADSLEVSVKWDGHRRKYLLIVRRLALPRELTKGAKIAMLARAFNAQEMAHRFGQAEPFEGSWAAAAWVARGEAPANRIHIVYGPYIDVSPGRYLVVFRLQLLEPRQGPVVAVDVAAGQEHRQLAQREIDGEQLKPGQWTAVALPVTLGQPADQVEFRVEQLKHAPLAVDRIYLVRLE